MSPPPFRLIVLDFSGTLSLAAVEFGRSENLVPVLAASGLFALGVTSEAFFWDEIVYPTWVEGSTTPRGYKAVLVDRIASLGLHASDDPDPRGSIGKAVTDLLDRYLDQCRIDPRWRTLLEALHENDGVRVLIATDHYAEATPLIKARLTDWEIAAVALAEAGPESGTPFIIANSADLGCHKADIRYWQRIRRILDPNGQSRILLVDDFGGNEDSDDPYGDPARVKSRQLETTRVLRKVFPGQVGIYPFIVDRSEINHFTMLDKDRLYGLYITKAVSHIRSFLASGPGV
ncbi:MAG TPA: hypothetical protein PK022_06360 [Syntrophales bacterium]|mgnify:CR=1 FL=1|nr:hypothetical protein [Syntrophales bacterium]